MRSSLLLPPKVEDQVKSKLKNTNRLKDPGSVLRKTRLSRSKRRLEVRQEVRSLRLDKVRLINATNLERAHPNRPAAMAKA